MYLLHLHYDQLCWALMVEISYILNFEFTLVKPQHMSSLYTTAARSDESCRFFMSAWYLIRTFCGAYFDDDYLFWQKHTLISLSHPMHPMLSPVRCYCVVSSSPKHDVDIGQGLYQLAIRPSNCFQTRIITCAVACYQLEDYFGMTHLDLPAEVLGIVPIHGHLCLDTKFERPSGLTLFSSLAWML